MIIDVRPHQRIGPRSGKGLSKSLSFDGQKEDAWSEGNRQFLSLGAKREAQRSMDKAQSKGYCETGPQSQVNMDSPSDL